MAAPTAVPPDAAVNRAAWAAVNAEYTAGQAAQAWKAGEFGWGIFGIPERELGVLGDVAGLDVVELGCGTAYLSAWLARQGARPVGLDVTHAQLLTARRCQQESGIWFPLVEADAGQVPLAAATFDLAVSECGASLYCEPGRWTGEAARLLRPGGRLVFHTVSVLAAMCQPGDGSAQPGLHRPQRDVRRLNGGRGVEYHPGHGEWISMLTATGLVIDALHELYAPPGATDHPYYQIATANWSRQWPVEDIWIAHRPAT
jgi:SAM-dependent methyltransferase